MLSMYLYMYMYQMVQCVCFVVAFVLYCLCVMENRQVRSYMYIHVVHHAVTAGDKCKR